MSNIEPSPPFPAATPPTPPSTPPPPISPPSSGSTSGAGSSPKEQGKQVAGAAAEQGKEVAGTAAEQGKQVAGAAAAGASQVAGEAAREIKDVAQTAADEVRGLVSQVGGELQSQASTQTDRLAEGLRTLSGQLRKAGSGQALEAGPVRDLAQQAGSTFDQLSTRLSEGGVDGVLHDVSTFARRRPGVFLAGAATAGFFAGRMLRGAQAAAKDEATGGTGSASPAMSRPSTTAPALGAPPLGAPLDPPLGAPLVDAPTFGTPSDPGIDVVVINDESAVGLPPGTVPAKPIGGPR